MTEQPNVVLVTIDSLRADHCGFMGYEKDTTPTLDEMAKEGIVFENAIAPGPATPASLPATHTGYYPLAVDGFSGLDDVRRTFYDHLNRHDTIAEEFSRRGYATAGFTPNPWTCRHFGFDNGFDHFEDFLGQDSSSGIWERMLEGRGSKPLSALRLFSNWTQRESTFKPWPSFYDDVVEWTEKVEKPYFVWIFLMDVHFPYLPDSESRTQSRWRTYEANLRLYLESQRTPYSARVHEQLETAYDDAVHYTDRFFENLRSDLDDSIFVVHADHGEGFGEHGTYGHHGQLYEPNVHVPLLISSEESPSWKQNDRVEDPVSVRSVPKILRQLATGTDPRSIGADDVITQTRGQSSVAVRGRDWKFIQSGDDTTNLYSLEAGESDPIGDERILNLAEKRLKTRFESERERKRVSAIVDEIAGEEKI